MEGSKEAGVLSVMSFGIMSSVLPHASLAAIFAMGNPVALEASAEERLQSVVVGGWGGAGGWVGWLDGGWGVGRGWVGGWGIEVGGHRWVAKP